MPCHQKSICTNFNFVYHGGHFIRRAGTDYISIVPNWGHDISTIMFFFIVIASQLQAQDASTPQTVATEQKDSPTLEQSEDTVGIAT
jgi:hypothetical protein